MKILLVVSIAILLVACNKSPPGASSSGAAAAGVSIKDVDTFAARAGIVIPPSAKATDYRSPLSRDGVMMLKLEMPQVDLGVFMSKSGLAGELNNTTRESAKSYLGDFLPAHPKKYREGQKSLSGGYFLNVLIDEDSSTTAVVYLYWFGT